MPESSKIFISYNHRDSTWAEWLAWELEESGYKTIIQAWDFAAGGNFVLEMDKAAKQADRTIAVLSPNYFNSSFTPSEWASAFAADPTGEKRKLVPVRVAQCDITGLLGQIVYIDLVGLEEEVARERLLAQMQAGEVGDKSRAKPKVKRAFPTSNVPDTDSATAKPAYPLLRELVSLGDDTSNAAATAKPADPLLLGRIQQDLFDFANPDPEDFAGLVEFWYQANSPALSAALANQPGINLIVNVSSFEAFETLSKKLFLVADTLILRDTRQWIEEEKEYRLIPTPTGPYKPGFYDEVIDRLQKMRPSPLTINLEQTLWWTSEKKKLNNGHEVAYAAALAGYHSIPNHFIEWLSGSGRTYMETGRIVYAPFIPPLEMELEFLKQDVNLPAYFNSMPCFHQRYDWLADSTLQALFALKFPFLDQIDIETLAKIKEDYYDEFTAFSRSLLDSVEHVKGAFGTENFTREIRYIQRNQIDAGLSDITKTVKKIEVMKTLREAGILVGLVGLNVATYLGAALPSIVTGLSAATVAIVADKIAHMKEQQELRNANPYFLWRLQQEIDK